jgi:hypothetical protein
MPFSAGCDLFRSRYMSDFLMYTRCDLEGKSRKMNLKIFKTLHKNTLTWSFGDLLCNRVELLPLTVPDVRLHSRGLRSGIWRTVYLLKIVLVVIKSYQKYILWQFAIKMIFKT